MRLLLIVGLVVSSLSLGEGFVNYLNCLGRFTKGFCFNDLVHSCPGNVMGGPISNSFPPGLTATLSATTVEQGDSITITLSLNQVRIAWAERGAFTGDSACLVNTETKIASNGGLGTSLTWTAPTNYVGDLLMTLVSNPGGQNPISRQTYTITVEQASNAPTSEPTLATIPPTSGSDVFAELLNFGQVNAQSTLGETILILADSTDELYLNSFVPGAGQGGDVTPVDACTTTGGNLLTGITSTGDNFYNGILGEDNFDTAIAVQGGSPTQFDDLLGGRGGGTYVFIKQDCRVTATGSCCNVANPAEQSRLTLEVIVPTTSPTSSPITSAPTSSPTGPFLLPVIDWVLPYTGANSPSLIEARVGDRLSFDLIDFSHNIIEIPTAEEFANCDFTNAVIVRDGLLLDVIPGSPEEITFSDIDIGTTRWFTCNRTTAPSPDNHCVRGQKLTVKIAARGTPEVINWNLAGDYTAGLDLEPSSTIDFLYNPAAHSVVQFSTKADFDACNLGAATALTDNEYASGNTIRIGSEVGTVEWYACGVVPGAGATHCEQGQKIAVRIVAAAAGPVNNPNTPLELDLMQILTLSTVGGGAIAGLVVVALRRRRGVILDDRYSTSLQHIGLAPETRPESYQMSDNQLKEPPFKESMEQNSSYGMPISNPRRKIESADLKF